ncbi:MAG: T9SS type A sorting domain-containing protein [Bacteroidetes bacterium]|nr:T9SS type A sorting domain-containing protein [Bacteroidota bacterium]
MKTVFIILLCLGSITYAQKTPQRFSTEQIAEMEAKAYERTTQQANATASSQNFDVKYYRCEWQVDPAVRFIKGKITSYFVILATSANVTYDLMSELHVDSVIQRGKPLLFVQQNNTVQINFTSSLNAGVLDSVSIYYQGIPANTGFGSFVNSTHNGVPDMWTLSEPYGSRDWWPCKNGLDDKADSIDVIITTPISYKAASNGLRQSETVTPLNVTTHWKHRYPIATYLICMAVSNYAEFTDYVSVAGMQLPMQTFCYPEDLNDFKTNTPLVLASLQYFSSILEPYPFLKEKYGHVQFGWGGGEEHQTSTFIVIPDEALMAHELAHQWFGDKITCGSWQHIWLNEGFASHLASMDYEKKYPQNLLNFRSGVIGVITSQPGGSVFVDDTTSVNRIFDSRLSYSKGSYLLYMLRWILGDSTFFAGVKKYLKDPSLTYGFALTKDLQRNLEEVSGKKLDYFFNQWFYGQGYPSYRVEWSAIGNGYLRIALNQTTSHVSVPFFQLPVPLLFKNATQQALIVLDNTFNGQTFFKTIGFIPDTVIVDPNYWLITKNNTAHKLEISVDPNTVLVYPSPFHQTFSMLLQNLAGTKVDFKIYDMKGALVYQQSSALNQSFFQEINAAAWPSGVYLLKITTDRNVKVVRKIIKN